MRGSGGETAGAITTSCCAPARLRQYHDTVPYREALASWLLRERLGQADQNDLIWMPRLVIPEEPPTVQNGGYRAMLATGDRHAARLVFQSASVLIAESVLPAVVKPELGTQHISTCPGSASLALFDLSGDCLIRMLRAGPGDGGNLARPLDERPTQAMRGPPVRGAAAAPDVPLCRLHYKVHKFQQM